MLTRDTSYFMVAITTQKKSSHGVAAIIANDTKAVVSKDVPLFFCVVYPCVYNHTYLRATLNGRPHGLSASVCADLLTHLNVARFVLADRADFQLTHLSKRRFVMNTNATSASIVPTQVKTHQNPASSIPQESYYTISLGKQAGTMGIIIKYHVDSRQWRFVDISAGITFLINPDTNSIHFPQHAHDKAIELFSNELQKFVSQRFPYGCEKDSHTTITLEQDNNQKLIGDTHMEKTSTNSNSNNLPQVFTFDQNTDIRTVIKNDEPYFIAKDVCNALDLTNSRQSIADLKANYESIGVNPDGVISTDVIADSLGRLQETTIVNETGLYDLIMQSRKPSALKFKHWISSEVLPSIRKTGGYSTGNYSYNNGFNDAVIGQVKKANILVKTLGLKGDKATQHIAKLVKESTGVDCLELLGITPSEPMPEPKYGNISQFFDECCTFGSLSDVKFRIKSKDLYERYLQWCMGNKEIPFTKQYFRKVVFVTGKVVEKRIGANSEFVLHGIAIDKKHLTI